MAKRDNIRYERMMIIITVLDLHFLSITLSLDSLTVLASLVIS